MRRPTLRLAVAPAHRHAAYTAHGGTAHGGAHAWEHARPGLASRLVPAEVALCGCRTPAAQKP